MSTLNGFYLFNGAYTGDLAAAQAGGNWIEGSFTTGNFSATGVDIVAMSHLPRGNVPFDWALSISDDNFTTETLLVTDQAHLTSAPALENTISLQPNTSYEVRVYAYNSAGGNGHRFDDLRLFNSQATDSDNDGLPDSLDIDSDNDGISDNVEAQATADYIAPSGIGGTAAFTDNNDDGLDDNFDAGVIAGGAPTGVGLTPVDTDISLTSADGVADFLDADSDNDGLMDSAEAGHGVSQAAIDASADTDLDGLKDVVEGADTDDGFDVNDENVDASGEFTLADNNANVNSGRANATALDINYDWREDQPPVIDLNSAASGTDTDLDFATTFTEGSAAVAVASATAGAGDFAEDDIIELSITVAGIADGVSEIVSVNGVSLALNADATDSTTSINGVAVTIDYVCLLYTSDAADE